MSQLRLPASARELKVRRHLCRDKQATEIQLQLGIELSLRSLPLMSSLGSSFGGKPLREKAHIILPCDDSRAGARRDHYVSSSKLARAGRGRGDRCHRWGWDLGLLSPQSVSPRFAVESGG
jgi:hypothetical protein